MIHVYASLLHHLLQVPIEQRAAVPTHIKQDDFWQKVTPFEQGASGSGKLRACQETTFTIYYLESLLRKHF